MQAVPPACLALLGDDPHDSRCYPLTPSTTLTALSVTSLPPTPGSPHDETYPLARETSTYSIPPCHTTHCNKSRRCYPGICPKWLTVLPYFAITASIVQITSFILFGSRYDVLAYHRHHRCEAWRYVSYMLLHTDVTHLALNCIIQCLIAVPLEVEQGSVRTAVVYLGGVVSGALGAAMLQPIPYMVGASAGVYAILLSHISNIVLNCSSMKHKLYRVLTVIILTTSDIVYSVIHLYTEGNPQICWAAHLSGALMGLCLGFVVYRYTTEKVNPSCVSRAAKYTSAFLLAIVVVFAVLDIVRCYKDGC